MKTIAENRKARFNYEILEKVEAGIVLQGTEVKSLRANGCSLAESHCAVDSGEMVLHNAHIPEYTEGNRNNHEPVRPRKLLLRRKQINKLAGAVQKQGMTVVPLKMYFNDRGRAKLEIGLGKGKKVRDKRETIKRRDWDREKSRVLKQKGRLS